MLEEREPPPHFASFRMTREGLAGFGVADARLVLWLSGCRFGLVPKRIQRANTWQEKPW